jgi:hypothetical protein
MHAQSNIRSGDVIENPVTGERLTFLEAAADTAGEYVLIEAELRPGAAVAAAHVHPFQTEAFEVLRARRVHVRSQEAHGGTGRDHHG